MPPIAASFQRVRGVAVRKGLITTPFGSRGRWEGEATEPMHPNFPRLALDDKDDWLPAVAETVGHPTAGEAARCCFSGSLSCCGWLMALLLLASALAAYNSPVFGFMLGDTGCEAGSNGTRVAECLTAPLVAKLTAQRCNTCSYSYDGTCDEPSSSLNPPASQAWTGLCSSGTDRFDCEASLARNAADSAAKDAEIWTFEEHFPWTAATGIFVVAGFGVTLLLYCCSSCSRRQCFVCSDNLFELVRSRALAIVQMQSLFLVLSARPTHSSTRRLAKGPSRSSQLELRTVSH